MLIVTQKYKSSHLNNRVAAPLNRILSYSPEVPPYKLILNTPGYLICWLTGPLFIVEMKANMTTFFNTFAIPLSLIKKYINIYVKLIESVNQSSLKIKLLFLLHLS